LFCQANPPENLTKVLGSGKAWHAKWWTQGNVLGAGTGADHQPWKLISPG
jgi:hypothetical protein